jgi:hypothetical protein
MKDREYIERCAVLYGAKPKYTSHDLELVIVISKLATPYAVTALLLKARTVRPLA